jgi:hypothetical protein
MLYVAVIGDGDQALLISALLSRTLAWPLDHALGVPFSFLFYIAVTTSFAVLQNECCLQGSST